MVFSASSHEKTSHKNTRSTCMTNCVEKYYGVHPYVEQSINDGHMLQICYGYKGILVISHENKKNKQIALLPAAQQKVNK